MMVETKKILDPKIKLTATCVRVPVFVGHSEAVNVEFEEPITADEARKILREAPGVLVVDKREPGGYVTPIECVGDYATYVSRIREDQTLDNGLSFWIVSDNLRKGAALNTVQIAETDHQPQPARPRRLRSAALARLPQHRCDWRRRSQLDRADGLETVPAIERHVPRARRLEIGWHPVGIADGERVAEQRRAVASALQRGVGSDEWQIPMRHFGMEPAHLLKRAEYRLLAVLRNRALEEGDERLLIGLDTRR